MKIIPLLALINLMISAYAVENRKFGMALLAFGIFLSFLGEIFVNRIKTLKEKL